MATTVSISFQENLLSDIDALAKRERRSRSDLVREAVRMYIEHRKHWNKVFSLGQATARRRSLTEEDVVAEIQVHRKSKST